MIYSSRTGLRSTKDATKCGASLFIVPRKAEICIIIKRIEMDSIWINLKNVGPPFFKFISVYIKMSFTKLENHSQLLCGHDFANGRLLLCQFDN